MIWMWLNLCIIVSLLLSIMSIERILKNCIVINSQLVRSEFKKAYFLLGTWIVAWVVYCITWGQAMIQVWGNLISEYFVYVSYSFARAFVIFLEVHRYISALFGANCFKCYLVIGTYTMSRLMHKHVTFCRLSVHETLT